MSKKKHQKNQPTWIHSFEILLAAGQMFWTCIWSACSWIGSTWALRKRFQWPGGHSWGSTPWNWLLTTGIARKALQDTLVIKSKAECQVQRSAKKTWDVCRSIKLSVKQKNSPIKTRNSIPTLCFSRKNWISGLLHAYLPSKFHIKSSKLQKNMPQLFDPKKYVRHKLAPTWLKLANGDAKPLNLRIFLHHLMLQNSGCSNKTALLVTSWRRKKKGHKKKETRDICNGYMYIYIFIYICLTMSTCCDFLSMNRNKNKQCLAPAVFRCERKHAEEKINERKHQWTMKGDYKLHIRLSTKPLNKKKTRLWNFEFLANKNPAINQKLAKSWHDTGCKTFKNSSKMSRRYCVDEPWHCLKLRSSLVQFLEI